MLVFVSAYFSYSFISLSPFFSSAHSCELTFSCVVVSFRKETHLCPIHSISVDTLQKTCCLFLTFIFTLKKFLWMFCWNTSQLYCIYYLTISVIVFYDSENSTRKMFILWKRNYKSRKFSYLLFLILNDPAVNYCWIELGTMICFFLSHSSHYYLSSVTIWPFWNKEMVQD